MSENNNEIYMCLDKDNIPKFKNKGMRAAFMRNKLWDQNKELKVSFMVGNPTRFNMYMSNPKQLQNRIRRNPLLKRITNFPEIKKYDEDKSKYDPLQFKIQNMKDPRKIVELVVKERIEPIVNTKFNFVESNGDIRISFYQGKGAYSFLGTDISRQPKKNNTMNLGWIDVATIIHEFCHALGMIHEHQNPFGKAIEWNKQELYKWAKERAGWNPDKVKTQIIKKYDSDLINGSDFDPESVMLYFYPDKVTMNNRGTKQNMRLSVTDIEWLQKIYPKETKKEPREIYYEFYGYYPGPKNMVDQNMVDQNMPNKIIPIVISIISIISIILVGIFILRKILKY